MAPLLGQQIDDVELLEGDEGSHDSGGRDDGADDGNSDVPCLHPEACAVQGSVVKSALRKPEPNLNKART